RFVGIEVGCGPIIGSEHEGAMLGRFAAGLVHGDGLAAVGNVGDGVVPGYSRPELAAVGVGEVQTGCLGAGRRCGLGRMARGGDVAALVGGIAAGLDVVVGDGAGVVARPGPIGGVGPLGVEDGVLGDGFVENEARGGVAAGFVQAEAGGNLLVQNRIGREQAA